MLSVVLALIGTVGIGGFIALMFFAPPIAERFSLIAVDLLRRIWATRAGVGAVVGVAAAYGGLVYGEREGAAHVQKKWDAAVQRTADQSIAARQQSEQEQPRLEPAPVAPVQSSTSCPVPPGPPRALNDGVLLNDPNNRLRGRK